jgi:WD40 repeat protein
VVAVAAVPLPGGRTLLATAGHDRTVRLWDPQRGTPVVELLRSATGFVDAILAVPLPDGRTLLATTIGPDGADLGRRDGDRDRPDRGDRIGAVPRRRSGRRGPTVDRVRWATAG